MGKLLPRSRFPGLRNVAPLLVDGKEKENGLIISMEGSDAATQLQQQQHSSSATHASGDSAAAERGAHASAGSGSGSSSPATAGKLFVFRDPPQSCDLVEPPRRKKKNFLNLKKSTVAPTDLP